MPTIVMTKWPVPVDGSVRAKAFDFLQKLAGDDTTLGLHVEPIKNSADPRVRTGRVDQFWRAVMFRLDDGGERHYVIHGVFPHDKAISVAGRITLTVNPVNGFPQIAEIAQPAAPSYVPVIPQPTAPPQLPAPAEPAEPAVFPEPVELPGRIEPAEPFERAEPAEAAGPAVSGPVDTPATPSATAEPLLARQGRTADQLVDVLGIPPDVAAEALAARDEDQLLTLAARHEGWLGLMLIDLAGGDSIDSIAERFEVARPAAPPDDAAVLDSMKRPAAQTQFAFIDDQDELQRVIESGDMKAWRTFLHPDQRRYVDATFSGPFRLSGGAGTGKTVVLIHRARALARRGPAARIVLTTFTTNLADALREGVTDLDPAVPLAGRVGDRGVHAAGVDSLAASVIRQAGTEMADAVVAVLGASRAAVNSRTPATRWRDVIDASSTPLPPSVATDALLAAEYALVVLPNRIRTVDEYLRVRRPGRGVALDRVRRRHVWDLIDAYRTQGRLDGTLDYAEAAAVAAAHLEATGPLVDHVLVDEGQDLSPTHWQVVRALVAPGPDDLFLAEDSHQRIYSQPIVLGRYGIRIVGRSRRLTLNYRTTAQNLRYALGILEGGSYVDLEDEAESTGYRSARLGPVPRITDVRSLTSELDAVCDVVQDWIDAGTPPGAVGVLVHDRYQRQRVVSALTERHVPAREIDRDRPKGDRVSVMTMHRAKGTEFPKVVLAGLGWSSDAERRRLAAMEVAERAHAELQARSLVYVAATRARDDLAVVRRT